MGKNLYTVLFFMATSICVGISGYLSYYGYLSHLKGLTIFFAILIVILLFTLDMLIRQNLIQGRSNFGVLVFFFVVAFFSGASNFNYLYTNFMATDMANREVRQQLQIFREDITRTKNALENIPELRQLRVKRAELDRELTSLFQQIQDPLRPGCGELCRGHVDTIYGMLGGAPTNLQIPGASATNSATKIWFDNFSNVVKTDLEKANASPITQETEQTLQEIEQALLELRDAEERYAQTDTANALNMGVGLTDQLRIVSQEIERRANSVLASNNYVTHRAIDTDIDKIREIPIAFHDAFINRPNLGVTTMALVLAIFVDIIPLLFAFLIFKSLSHINANSHTRRRSSRVAT